MKTKSMIESVWVEDMGQSRYHLDPNTRKITESFEKIELKVINKQCSTIFYKTCLNNNLLLKYTLLYIYILLQGDTHAPYLFIICLDYVLRTSIEILTIRRILEGVWAKNLQATILFVNFTKAFDSIHRGKMEQILLAYGIPKETVAAITILYRNTRVKELHSMETQTTST